MRANMRETLLAITIFLTVIGSFLLQPGGAIKTDRDDLNLQDLLPLSFNNWVLEEKSTALIVNADVKSELEKIYSQTLSKTYINKNTGYKVMLSIAYGKEQSQSLQIHRPEVCYAAQGFSISNERKTTINVLGTEIPVLQINAFLGSREEPITYWVRIGDKLVRGNIEQGLARLQYGLKREIPDGILVRVSSIDGDYKNAFTIQNQFIDSFISSLSLDGKKILLGNEWSIANIERNHK